jgi:hypothetical protein
MFLFFILGAFYGGIKKVEPKFSTPFKSPRKNQRLKTGMYFEKPDFTSEEQQDELEYEIEQKILKHIKEEEKE